VTVVLLVRHGQASFGAADYDVLSELGERQSRVVGAALAARRVRPDVVVHGSMRRQQETAKALVSAAGWPAPVLEDAGWDEMDHLQVLARHPQPFTVMPPRRESSRPGSRRPPSGGPAGSSTTSTTSRSRRSAPGSGTP
jgi:broad specificity phosphatase PhoE